MGNEFLTIAELAAVNAASDIAELIEQSLKFAPEIGLLPSRIITGTEYNTIARTQLPKSSFRKLNEGVETGKSRYEPRKAQMRYLDGQLQVDRAAAQSDSRGVGRVLDWELAGQMEAHIRTLGAQLWYGTKAGGDSNGPLGGIDVIEPTLVVDAGGTTDVTASSVWAVNISPRMLELLWGNDQVLTRKPWREQQVVDPAGTKRMTAFVNALEGWAGYSWVDKFSLGRIKKLTADSGKGMTDNLAYSLWAKFPSGRKPTHWVMSKRSREQLRLSRVTSLIPTPELPNTLTGLPIIETESILDTETLAL